MHVWVGATSQICFLQNLSHKAGKPQHIRGSMPTHDRVHTRYTKLNNERVRAVQWYPAFLLAIHIHKTSTIKEHWVPANKTNQL